MYIPHKKNCSFTYIILILFYPFFDRRKSWYYWYYPVRDFVIRNMVKYTFYILLENLVCTLPFLKSPNRPDPSCGLAWLNKHSIVEDNKVSPDHQLLSSPILWRWTLGIDKATGRYWHSTPEIDPPQTGVKHKTAPSKTIGLQKVRGNRSERECRLSFFLSMPFYILTKEWEGREGCSRAGKAANAQQLQFCQWPTWQKML